MNTDTSNRYVPLPYTELAKVGLSRELLETMPSQFVDALKRGEVTPIVKISVVASNGAVVTLPLRLQVVHDGTSAEPRLMAFPTRSQLDNTLNLSRYELEKLRDGETLSKELMINGKREAHLIQYDGRTNSLVHTPAAAMRLDERMRELESINDIQLGSQQKEQIRLGRPVELSVGDEKVTVGVDLREPHHFKVIKGDMEEWKRRELERYDIAHPEVMGFVKTDRNRWEYQQVVNRQSHNSGLRQDGHERTAGLHI